MPQYEVRVMVELLYTVDVATESHAVAEARNWECYRQHSSIYSLDIAELENYDEDITERDTEDE